jgi:mono/diheme cytochrome c family protein
MSVRKIASIVCCSLAAVVLGILFVIVLLYVAPAPKYSSPNIEMKIDVTAARVLEGKRIVNTICRGCHYDEATNTLAGAMITNPEEIEDNYASNITQDSITGIGKYSYGELAYMLRTGINKKGNFVYDMPKYPLLSDEDLACILAFLKSDDSLVRPVSNNYSPPRPNLLVKALLYTILRPEQFPTKPIAPPDTANKIEFGEYLSTAKFSCFACHSNDFVGNLHWSDPSKSKNYFAGGAKHTNANHEFIYSANLTPDKATGIGGWTEQEFIKAVKNGIKPDGTTVRDPMFPFYLLTDKEVAAIYAYLMTLKPRQTDVK